LFNNARCGGAISLFEGRTKEVRAEESEPLNRAIAYRRRARACHALVRHAQNEDQRLQLLAMAETWESLAIEREAMLSAD
jgi:hypothetical protein